MKLQNQNRKSYVRIHNILIFILRRILNNCMMTFVLGKALYTQLYAWRVTNTDDEDNIQVGPRERVCTTWWWFVQSITLFLKHVVCAWMEFNSLAHCWSPTGMISLLLFWYYDNVCTECKNMKSMYRWQHAVTNTTSMNKMWGVVINIITMYRIVKCS